MHILTHISFLPSTSICRYTDFYLPGIMLLVFLASLVAFHHIPFKPRMKPRYSLADIKARKAAQDEQMRQQQQVEFAN